MLENAVFLQPSILNSTKLIMLNIYFCIHKGCYIRRRENSVCENKKGNYQDQQNRKVKCR